MSSASWSPTRRRNGARWWSSRAYRWINGTRRGWHWLQLRLAVPQHVHRRRLAKRLGALTRGWRVGAWAGDQVDRQFHVPQRSGRSPGAKGIGGCENDLRRRSPGFQPPEKDRDIGSEHVTAAFDQDGIGRYGEAGVERPVEDAIHVLAIRWIRGGQSEIDAIESLRGPVVAVGRDFGHRGSAGRFQHDHPRMPFCQQRSQHTDADRSLADLGGCTNDE